MSIELITLLMFGGLTLFLLSGMPIGFASGGIAAIFTLFMWGPDSLFMIANRAFGWMNTRTLIAVPMFVFMANMLSKSGAIDDLFNAVYIWAGPLRGGLAVVTILASTVMAAMSGIVGATEVTMGLIALPAMLERKYDKRLAVGCIAAGGSLGYLIPPSILFVLYGMAAEQSIGKLFMGGIIPGLLLAASYILYICIRAYLNPNLAPALSLEERQAVPISERITMLKDLVLPTLLILAVLGSIYLGVATITESAGVGAIGSVLIALIHRRFTWENVKTSSYLTMRVSAMIMWLMIGSSSFISVYTALGGTEFAQAILSTMPFGRWGVLVVIQFLLIFMGCFLDWAGILLLTTPIFLPILTSMGFDPIWYGVLFNVNMQISLISPPFGPALFYLKGTVPPGITMGDLYRGSSPFIFIQLFVLALCIVFPEIVLFLPNQLK